MPDTAKRRLPAEWEPQDGVMLTWPHEATSWVSQLEEVERVYLDLARNINSHERLLIVCNDRDHLAHVKKCLRQNDITEARLALAPSNDTWARDHGPICVRDDHHPLLLDFQFNGWGGKYPATLDNAINVQLYEADCFSAKLKKMDFILEGGAIDSDGQGSLLTTRHCLLSPTRNAGLGEHEIETRLRTWFGIKRVLWLDHGRLEGDDTDGHIDTLARFCDASTIAYVRCDDPADSHHAELSAMEDELQSLIQSNGQPYRLLPLPLPGKQHDATGQRLPATYANFLIINGAVLVPTYRDPVNDQEALAILSKAFPDRAIVGIDCVPLIQQFGSLHCITMQLPKGTLRVI